MKNNVLLFHHLKNLNKNNNMCFNNSNQYSNVSLYFNKNSVYSNTKTTLKSNTSSISSLTKSSGNSLSISGIRNNRVFSDKSLRKKEKISGFSVAFFERKAAEVIKRKYRDCGSSYWKLQIEKLVIYGGKRKRTKNKSQLRCVYDENNVEFDSVNKEHIKDYYSLIISLNKLSMYTKFFSHFFLYFTKPTFCSYVFNKIINENNSKKIMEFDKEKKLRNNGKFDDYEEFNSNNEIIFSNSIKEKIADVNSNDEVSSIRHVRKISSSNTTKGSVNLLLNIINSKRSKFAWSKNTNSSNFNSIINVKKSAKGKKGVSRNKTSDVYVWNFRSNNEKQRYILNSEDKIIESNREVSAFNSQFNSMSGQKSVNNNTIEAKKSNNEKSKRIILAKNKRKQKSYNFCSGNDICNNKRKEYKFINKYAKLFKQSE